VREREPSFFLFSHENDTFSSNEKRHTIWWEGYKKDVLSLRGRFICLVRGYHQHPWRRMPSLYMKPIISWEKPLWRKKYASLIPWEGYPLYPLYLTRRMASISHEGGNLNLIIQ
jgi:hypothetical protein